MRLMSSERILKQKRKNKFLSLMLVFLLAGCSFFDFDKYKDWYLIDDSTISSNIDSEIDIYNWSLNNINYISDRENNGRKDYLQIPRETLKKRKGDCEDIALLDLAIWYARQNKKGSLDYLTSKTGKGHVEPNFKGKIFYDDFFEKIKEYSWNDISYLIYKINDFNGHW